MRSLLLLLYYDDCNDFFSAGQLLGQEASSGQHGKTSVLKLFSTRP
jgi:hypothetical protein